MKNKHNIINRIATFVFAIILGAFAIGSVSAKETNILRMALLPIPDVLPIYVAEASGYFKDAGIVVEPLPVGSAMERDQLMQAGRIDGMINEVGGAALFNRDKLQMKIVSYARIPMNQAPLFRVLASPGSNITKVDELAGVPVAVSRNTVIEYITRRMLESAGVAKDDIAYASVPVLPERMQLLLSGQIKAATLPDPLGFAALKAGAIEVVNDLTLPELSASVVSFGQRAITEKGESIKKFLEAWDRAAADLNRDPEKFRSLMLEKIRVPKNVQQSFVIPPFPRGKVPSKPQWDDTQNWLMERGLLKQKVDYEISVTSDFIKKDN